MVHCTRGPSRQRSLPQLMETRLHHLIRQGGIPQAMYPINPYMLGIVMPTAVTQSNQSGQSVPTTATSPSATAAAAAAAISVASYSYNNQNAAIAAAFDSFVPIAPAASPRFTQTLAHLASAYTPFLPRGAIPAMPLYNLLHRGWCR